MNPAGKALSRFTHLSLRLMGRRTGAHLWAFVHWTVEYGEKRPGQIRLGERVLINRNAWLNVPLAASPTPTIVIHPFSRVGRHSMISARNRIEIGDHVGISPNCLLMDHAHEYRDIDRSVGEQGVTEGGEIEIGPGCWIGFGAAIIASAGVLTIGRNCVIGANAVVTRSIPDYSVACGSPARVVKRYDRERGEWVSTGGDRPVEMAPPQAEAFLTR